jgi:hypothetical protein
MIGFAKAIDGLYYLRLSDKVVHASITTATTHTQTIPKAALWHFRLGYLCSNKMLALHSRYSHLC